MVNNQARIKGRVTLRGYNNRGRLVFFHIINNLIVTTGINHIADQLSDQGENAMSHMAVGTDNTAPAAGQTALGSEIARVALDSVTQAANVVTYVATFGPGVGTGSLREAGIFNAASNGIMLTRSIYVYDKGAGDTLVVNWDVEFAAA